MNPKSSSNRCRTQLGCCRATMAASVSPSPLPSSPPHCCGGSSTLCWKKPLCSSRGHRRRTVRRLRHRRCCRSSPTTGSLRQRAGVREVTAACLARPPQPRAAKIQLPCHPSVLLPTIGGTGEAGECGPGRTWTRCFLCLFEGLIES